MLYILFRCGGDDLEESGYTFRVAVKFFVERGSGLRCKKKIRNYQRLSAIELTLLIKLVSLEVDCCSKTWSRCTKTG